VSEALANVFAAIKYWSIVQFIAMFENAAVLVAV
jgi:hypothetical protein